MHSHNKFHSGRGGHRGGSHSDRKPTQSVTYDPPSFADVETWIASNPTREFLPPKYVVAPVPATLSKPVETLVPGPWLGTNQYTTLKQYPYTSAALWAADPEWRNLDAAGKQRTCEESCSKLYLGWAETFKTRGYKALGWKAVDIEKVLANTRQDPTGETEHDKAALHALVDHLGVQFICIDSKDSDKYTLIPQEWNPDVEHIVLIKSKSGFSIVVLTDSDTWSLHELAGYLSELTYSVQPHKKDLAALTAAELKDSCAAAEIKLVGRATKESMWIALQQHAMSTFWDDMASAVE